MDKAQFLRCWWLYSARRKQLGTLCLQRSCAIISSLPARKCRQRLLLLDLWRFILAVCEVATPSIVIKFVFIIKISKLFKVDLVAQNGANPTKPLHKLITFAGPV